MDPNHILESTDLNEIEAMLPALRRDMPSWARLVQLLVNNVRNGRIALNAAVEQIGLNLENT